MIYRIVILAALLAAVVLFSAQSWVGHLEIMTSAPTGSCEPGRISVDTVGQKFYICPTSGTWGTATLGSSSAAVPSGAILLVNSGTCPSGFTEVTALDGKFLQGTVNAHSDVGGTGGNSTITPTGSVAAPAFTGSSGTITAETFTGDATTVPALAAGTLVHAHTHTITQSSITTTKFTTNASGSAAYTGGGVVTTPSGAASSTAVTGSTATGTLTPLGHNGTVSFTPAGTNTAPAFTGNAIDPRPQYVKVIFCSAN